MQGLSLSGWGTPLEALPHLQVCRPSEWPVGLAREALGSGAHPHPRGVVSRPRGRLCLSLSVLLVADAFSLIWH